MTDTLPDSDAKNGDSRSRIDFIEPLPWWFRPYAFIPMVALCFHLIGWGVMYDWMKTRHAPPYLPYFFEGFGDYGGTAVYATTKITLWLCGLASAAALLSGGAQECKSIKKMRLCFQPCVVHAMAIVFTGLYLRFGWEKGEKMSHGGYELFGLATIVFSALFVTVTWTRRKPLEVRAAFLFFISLIWPFLRPPAM